MVFFALAARIRTSPIFRLLSPKMAPLPPGVEFALRPTMTRRPTLTYMAVSLVSLICSGALFRTYLYDWSVGKGESMLMTLPSTGVINIRSSRHRYGKGVKVGDLVSVKNPMFPQEYLCKRVIGMPGDYVVADANLDATVGRAVFHGIVGDGGRAAREDAAENGRPEPKMYRVPEGHVWLVGDNLGGSRDSRFIGPIPMALIEGKSVLIGDGWFDWTWVGDDWTDGRQRVIGARKPAARSNDAIYD